MKYNHVEDGFERIELDIGTLFIGCFGSPIFEDSLIPQANLYNAVSVCWRNTGTAQSTR